MSQVFNDTEEMPEDRGDDALCLNCGKNFGRHSNWSCPISIGNYYLLFGFKSKCFPNQRYYTLDMQDSELQKKKIYVKCIDDSGLTLVHNGTIYEVLKEHARIYDILVGGNPPNVCYSKHRFIKIDAPELISSNTSPSIKKDLDLSDWKNWRSQAPGECPCGMLRQVCEYHRE